tara:strand:+ start:3604 stop:4731 length:1128 start_codon:yes stop_codon:yes gene_type:complete
MKRLLICCGDTNDPSTHGGLSYYLLQAGMKNGLLHGGLNLNPYKLKPLGYIWNFIQLIKFGKAGGFQYSNIFNKLIFSQANLSVEDDIHFLSHYPLLPPFPLQEKWKVDFYIDATTSQIFDFYGIGKRIDSYFQSKILEREKQIYQKAGSIICRSKWAANSVMEDYSINPKKVHVVPGGANINVENQTSKDLSERIPSPSIKKPLKLGFLGKDWNRKGGPFLIQIIEELNSLGIPSVIRCIGPDSKDLPSHESIQNMGFIDKQNNLNAFIEEISTWHFGTLFSKAEAFGISNRECLLIGVPVLTHSIGGIPSTIPDNECGIMFPPNPQAIDVAKCIKSLIFPYENYLEWRERLAKRKKEFTWDDSVGKLKKILIT